MIFNIGDKLRRNVLVSSDHGTMIVNRFDCNQDRVGHSQWIMDHGNTSTIEASKCFETIRHLDKPIIFDVGANIGTFTTWMANAFPRGKIFAFEPQRAVFQMLCGNMAINNLYNVYTHNCGLDMCNGTTVFEEPDYFSNNDFGTFSLVEKIITETTGEYIKINLYSIDSFCKWQDIPTIDLIKVDAEGMDLQILMGATDIIAECKPVLFVEHCDNRKSILESLKDFLNPFGYTYLMVGNNVLASIDRLN